MEPGSEGVQITVGVHVVPHDPVVGVLVLKNVRFAIDYIVLPALQVYLDHLPKPQSTCSPRVFLNLEEYTLAGMVRSYHDIC